MDRYNRFLKPRSGSATGDAQRQLQSYQETEAQKTVSTDRDEFLPRVMLRPAQMDYLLTMFPNGFARNPVPAA